jgi:hypothetical protein
MMNDGADLVKAGVEAMMRPIADIVDKIAGPGAEELGLTVQDHIKVLRFKRQVRLFEQVKRICLEAGIEPRRVPLKLLAPIVEAASVEEDDDLQDIWARLLVSAADPATKNTDAMPSYLSVLRELSSNDVKFLNAWYDTFMTFQSDDFIPSRAAITNRRFTLPELLPTFHNAVRVRYQGVGNSHIDITVENLAAMLAVLSRHSLVTRFVDDHTIIRTAPLSSSAGDDPASYNLTDFGVMFNAACRGSQTVA